MLEMEVEKAKDLIMLCPFDNKIEPHFEKNKTEKLTQKKQKKKTTKEKTKRTFS
jgi:hypothetical protein